MKPKKKTKKTKQGQQSTDQIIHQLIIQRKLQQEALTKIKDSVDHQSAKKDVLKGSKPGTEKYT